MIFFVIVMDRKFFQIVKKNELKFTSMVHLLKHDVHIFLNDLIENDKLVLGLLASG